MVGLTKPDGTWDSLFKHDEYGIMEEDRGQAWNNFQYTGVNNSQTSGLYHLKARHYNVTVGRFITQDTRLGLQVGPKVAMVGAPVGLGTMAFLTGRADRLPDGSGAGGGIPIGAGGQAGLWIGQKIQLVIAGFVALFGGALGAGGSQTVTPEAGGPVVVSTPAESPGQVTMTTDPVTNAYGPVVVITPADPFNLVTTMTTPITNPSDPLTTVQATDITSWPALEGQDLTTIKDMLREDGYINYPRNPASGASDIWYDPASGSRVRIDEAGDKTNAVPHLHKEKINPGESSRTKVRGPGAQRFDDQGSEVPGTDPQWADKIHIRIAP